MKHECGSGICTQCHSCGVYEDMSNKSMIIDKDGQFMILIDGAYKSQLCTTPKVVCVVKGNNRIHLGKLYTVLHIDDHITIVRDEEGYDTAYPSRVFRTEDYLPKLKVGTVYDVRYINGGLPNRIKILGMSYYNSSQDIWFYKVQIESTGSIVNMSEKFILPRIINKDKPIYKLPRIRQMYDTGWRFFGIKPSNNADDKLQQLQDNKLVDKVAVTEAYNMSGKRIDNHIAIWFKYKNQLYGGGI